MNSRIPVWCLAGTSFVAVACANEPPTQSSDGDHPKTHAVVTIERTEAAQSEAAGSSAAIARFVSVPAFSDPSRVLLAAGATVDLPAPETCQAADLQEDAALPPQGPVEFLEAGDVAVAAAGSQTPLVPHVFPPIGSFASGVLYTTLDRVASALPSAVPYVVSASGSASVNALHLVTDAPLAPANVTVSGSALRDVTEMRTSRSLELGWTPGDSATDLVYVELVAYDGSQSVLCTFHDAAGAGTIAAEAFSGTGSGRLAVHRLRTHHFETANAPPTEVRFDFQVGAAIEFVK